MFKRINKRALVEAVKSDSALKEQILEGLKYKRTYGFLLLAFLILLIVLVALEGIDAIASPIGIICGFNLLVALSAATNNNSQLELLEVIGELKRLPQCDEKKDSTED